MNDEKLKEGLRIFVENYQVDEYLNISENIIVDYLLDNLKNIRDDWSGIDSLGDTNE